MTVRNKEYSYGLAGGQRNVPKIGRGTAKCLHKIGRDTAKCLKQHQNSSLRIVTWNIGSMTRKSLELEDVMKRRRIDIMCVQETKWSNLGNKARFLDFRSKNCKIYYHGTSSRNGVGIILSKKWQSKIIDIVKISDRLMMIKLVIQRDVYNVVSAYAPQTGCSINDKNQFWSDFEDLIQGIPSDELVFVGADFNGHVGESNIGYEECHGGFACGLRNEQGEELLDFCKAYGLTIVNTWFKKKRKHLITYSSGQHDTQIDFLLCSNDIHKLLRDCKVIPGESVVSQHRIVLAELKLSPIMENNRQKDQSIPIRKVKWFNLMKNDNTEFWNEMKEWLCDIVEDEDELTADEMWRAFDVVCVDKAKKHLGVSKGRLGIEKEAWWWNEETREAVRNKKRAFVAWKTCDKNLKEERNLLHQEYKQAKKLSARSVARAQEQETRQFYEDLETPEGSKKLYQIAAQRRNVAKSIVSPKYIKNENGDTLVDEDKICDRWRQYYEQLLNEEFPRAVLPTEVPIEEEVDDITIEEVENAVTRMKRNKAVGPDNIPSEFWLKCGEIGFNFLRILFNKILRGLPMPQMFRSSYLLPFYKNKGDSRECKNYRGIKLLPHSMKIWERIIDTRIRSIVQFDKNQCGFVNGRSTIDAIQVIRLLMEKHRDANKDLHMIFIDLEKAFDRVPRDLIVAAMRSHEIPETYVKVVKDMYADIETMIRCTSGTSQSFAIRVGVHQGSVCSPLLFNLVMDYLTRDVMKNGLKTLLFADDIALIDDDIQRLQDTLNEWRRCLEGNGLRISRDKTEYMHCPFEVPANPTPDLYLDGQLLKSCRKFKYLGSILSEDTKCEDDLNHRVSVGWMKFQQNSAILCDRKMPAALKGKIYATVIRPALTYGTECWTTYESYKSKMRSTEMKMLRMSLGVTLKDKIRSTNVRGSLKVKNEIEENMKEKQLRWYGHIKRRDPQHIVHEAMNYNITCTRRRGRPQKSWQRQLEKQQRDYGITDEEIQDRAQYRRRLRTMNTNPGRRAAAGQN